MLEEDPAAPKEVKAGVEVDQEADQEEVQGLAHPLEEGQDQEEVKQVIHQAKEGAE